MPTPSPAVVYRVLTLLCCALAGVSCATLPTTQASRTHVAIEGAGWLIDGRPPHPGSQAEGLLMNVRMVNAVFEDTGPAGRAHLDGFDPDANTTRFIARMPEYLAQGVRAFTVGLQGGMPGYEGAVNSAFNSDGSLRPDYMTRVARVVDAADRLGAVVILSAFYQRQHSHDRAIASRSVARVAVAGVARWIRDRGYRNVVLEVSNEYRHAGFARWADGEWLRSVEGQVDLIRHAKAAAPRLLVSTSGMGDGTMPDAIADAADFLLIHLNTTPLEAIPRAVRRARRHGKPVVVNEDDKMGEAGAEAARLAVEHGAGWGFMHRAKNQSVPFEYEAAADDPVVYAMIRRLTTPPAAGYFPPPDVEQAMVGRVAAGGEDTEDARGLTSARTLWCEPGAAGSCCVPPRSLPRSIDPDRHPRRLRNAPSRGTLATTRETRHVQDDFAEGTFPGRAGRRVPVAGNRGRAGRTSVPRR